MQKKIKEGDDKIKMILEATTDNSIQNSIQQIEE